MNTVIIINLNGNAFHLEEPGFASLRAYLERAQAQLKDNPDKSRNHGGSRTGDRG